MQQMVSWKYWFGMVVIALSSFAAPVWSQQSTGAAPSPAGSDAKSYVEAGIADGKKGDLNGATANFTQAVQTDPNYAPAHFNLGLAYAIQNKSNDALAEYSKAIQLDPKYAQAYYQRGTLKGQTADFDGAISDFNQVITLNPDFGPAYYNRGHVQYFKGDLDTALAQINQAISLTPGFPYSYFIRGLIQHARGHGAEALSDFQKSLGLGFADAALPIWIIENENGQHDAATKDLSDVLAKPGLVKPDSWTAQVGNFLLGKITQDQLIAKAGESNPAVVNERFCEAWYYTGVVKRLAGDTKGARDCFTKAISTGAKGAEEYIEANREIAKLPSGT
jgi:tetratricopeptide (TPR) repeat protein